MLKAIAGVLLEPSGFKTWRLEEGKATKTFVSACVYFFAVGMSRFLSEKLIICLAAVSQKAPITPPSSSTYYQLV